MDLLLPRFVIVRLGCSGVCVCLCFVSWIRLFVLVGLVVNHGEQGGIGKQFEFVEYVCSRSAASSQTLSFASDGVTRISVVTFKRS